jgi:hypothetical protein
MSDAPLTQCPACGQASYVKQVTAAGFQLKGSGWYVTDFRDGGKKPASTHQTSDAKGDGKATGDAATAADAGCAGSGSTGGATAANTASTAASAPASNPKTPTPTTSSNPTT